MDFTFHNVEITVSADTAEEAYTHLCHLLSNDNRVAFRTDTYSVDGDLSSEEINTEELVTVTANQDTVR
jgi:hypothetical protein